MPRYFFNTQDGEYDEDDQGVEFPSDAEARIAAIRYAGDLLSDNPDLLKNGHDFSVFAIDESGRPVFTVSTSFFKGGAPGADAASGSNIRQTTV